MGRINDGEGRQVEQIAVKVRERREGELGEEGLVEGGGIVVGRLASAIVVVIVGGGAGVGEHVGREGEDVVHAEI
jgi:hypothetical protein